MADFQVDCQKIDHLMVHLKMEQLIESARRFIDLGGANHAKGRHQAAFFVIRAALA
jgi:hypothetical protein